MVYVQTFEVTGRLSFPLDMLRYDGCYPSSQDDVGALIQAVGRNHNPEDMPVGGHRVRLTRIVFQKNDEPTYDRWASFSWSVDRKSVVTRKR